MTKSKSVTEGEIPLYLLPHAISRHVCRFGNSVYRISVKRTHWHHYNISVRTKSLPKELAPVRVTRLAGAKDSITKPRHSTGEPDLRRIA